MKKILYIDMDNVLVDVESAFPKLQKEVYEKYKDNVQNTPHIFSLMDPLPGAIDAYEKLSKVFDTYLLSTGPWENPTAWSDKLIWVKKYLGEYAYKRLILSHYKNLNYGHFLIDDRLKNGADRFMGEHLHFGTEKFPDWDSVLNYLTGK